MDFNQVATCLKVLNYLLCLCHRNSKSKHRAVISLICNQSLPQNEAVFEYVGTINVQVDTYVSTYQWIHWLKMSNISGVDIFFT